MKKRIKRATGKNRRNSSKIKRIMQPPVRYSFNDIFTSYPAIGIIIPKYNIILNNSVVPAGQSVNQATLVGGLNLFNYIGHDLVAQWNPATSQLNILGFY